MSSEASAQDFLQWTHAQYRLHIMPVVIGASIGFILFGVSLHQFLHVFKLMHERATTYSRSWWIIVVLFWLSFGDTLNKLILFVNYMEGATLHGILLFVRPVDPTIIPTAIFQGGLIVFVQLLYVNRILRIVRSTGAKFNPSHRQAKLLTYVCLGVAGVLIITSLVGFAWGAIVEDRPIIHYFPDLLVPGILSLGCASAVDAILCACMVYHLQQHKTKSDFDKTNFMATKFIKLTLETGLIPTVVQFLELLFIIFKPRSGWWGAVGYFIAKLYVIAALALYEAAFATDVSTISRGNMPPSQLSRGRFQDQILVTEMSVQHADVMEQSVQLKDVRSPQFFHEKKADPVSNAPSYEV
ncbi:hypothetical protein BT69DRAFT_1028342 [Atractiella rhizophila]|nr:hypothetical protein BT69DRAFT_1028342 [Atractiella rhizophila]